MSWYPTQLSDLIPFHATFNTECGNYAATFPSILDIAALAKILANKNSVVILVNAADLAKNYSADIIEYRDIWLTAPLGTTTPPAPVAPAAIVVAAGTAVGIEAYTRLIAGQLNAHPLMTDAIRAAMGISGTASGLGDPEIVSVEPLGDSHTRLRLRMAGYSALAVNRTRNGVTERIGTSITATFIDTSGPLVAGQSEVRSYTVQGIVDNVEQGTISAAVQVATTP